jgi:hypothetical protein
MSFLKKNDICKTDDSTSKILKKNFHFERKIRLIVVAIRVFNALLLKFSFKKCFMKKSKFFSPKLFKSNFYFVNWN